MKKLLYICNVHAGKSQVKGHAVDVIDQMIQAGYRVEVYITQGPGDAVQMAKRRGPWVDRILCSGGDGTLNEVVSGLMRLPEEKRPPVAYIPAGTTNDYARSLGLPVRFSKATTIAAGDVVCPVDVGRAAESYFNYVFGFGIFTAVSYVTPQEAKKVLGHQAYVLEGIKSLVDTKPYAMRITWGEQSLEGRFLLGIVTNSQSVGGMKGLWGEDISLNDGLFEVTLVREPSNITKWGELPGALLSKSTGSDLVLRFKTDRICFEAEEDVDWVKDGEFAGTFHRVDVENLHHALQMVVKELL